MENSINKKGIWISIISIIFNTLLSVAKAVVGALTGSFALIADGVHSASDVATTVMVLISLKLSSKQADYDHPYGHEKYEPVVGVILATVLAMVSLDLAIESVAKFVHHDVIVMTNMAVIVTVCSIVFKFLLYFVTYIIGKRAKSTALIADAYHHLSDSISSIAVLGGLIGVMYGVPWLEPVAALVVCVVLFKVAADIFVMSRDQIIDKAAPEAILREIIDIAEAQSGVGRVDRLRTRRHANSYYADLEIAVEPSVSLEKAHATAERVHRAVENNVEGVKHCMVHVNPKY
ncbi:MAG: cation diffusion facilitator family transporter [Clostridiales bacterium]|jgi:cation diffusion facilitator family transporter|nr:cation diffusion facilitator family transporter [Clostridiales bacterium]